MNFHRVFISAMGATLLLAGCVSNGILIGDSPSDPPPQLAFLGAKNAKNQDYLTWENVSSFGKVPPSLKAAGDTSCMQLGLELRATGYHPRARDRNGQFIAGGGFFCQAVITLAYDAVAPKLVNQSGITLWDRPGAFGAIPENLMESATTECGKRNQKPLAYHPNAVGSDGLPLAGGGFLCNPLLF